MNEESALYWNGRPFVVCIEDTRTLPQEDGPQAIELLEEFRAACHMYYFAFSHATLGYKAQYDRYVRIIDPSNYKTPISTGSSFPNAKQSPGRSTIERRPPDICLGRWPTWHLRRGGTSSIRDAKSPSVGGRVSKVRPVYTLLGRCTSISSINPFMS